MRPQLTALLHVHGVVACNYIALGSSDHGSMNKTEHRTYSRSAHCPLAITNVLYSALEATVTKLERALEDVLERLGMPALDLYVTPTIVGPTDRPRSTRRGSSVTVEDHTNVASEPLNSLIEVTNLHGLRSELRSAKQRRKGGMSRMDADLISEKVITYEEGEALLAL